MSRNELSRRRASVSRHDVALACNAKRTSGEFLVVSGQCWRCKLRSPGTVNIRKILMTAVGQVRIVDFFSVGSW
jgi:hypothetical protein